MCLSWKVFLIVLMCVQVFFWETMSWLTAGLQLDTTDRCSLIADILTSFEYNMKMSSQKCNSDPEKVLRSKIEIKSIRWTLWLFYLKVQKDYLGWCEESGSLERTSDQLQAYWTRPVFFRHWSMNSETGRPALCFRKLQYPETSRTADDSFLFSSLEADSGGLKGARARTERWEETTDIP